MSDQLIQPRFGNRAVTLGINVDSVSSSRWLLIDEHAKSHGTASRCRPHDEVKIAGVEAVRDAPVGLIEHGELFLHCPIARHSPLIKLQASRSSIDARLVQYCAAGRREVLGAPI